MKHFLSPYLCNGKLTTTVHSFIVPIYNVDNNGHECQFGDNFEKTECTPRFHSFVY